MSTRNSQSQLQAQVSGFFQHVGAVAGLGRETLSTLYRKRFPWKLFIEQMEIVGIQSIGVALTTAMFVGIVMMIQFISAMERFGAIAMVANVVALAEARQLAPALTGLVVGAKIGAGMTAEIGSMVVTEQVDAIRALGANPIRKLVVPRVLAATAVMPLLTVMSIVVGIGSAIAVGDISYGLAIEQSYKVAKSAIEFRDVVTGCGKTVFFGMLTALIACYFGLTTRGGTEGVGRATTRSVVVICISVLVCDALLTQCLLVLFTT
jgi:phospholipid/cholesterol/gamma-HCH transport system permease protein